MTPAPGPICRRRGTLEVRKTESGVRQFLHAAGKSTKGRSWDRPLASLHSWRVRRDYDFLVALASARPLSLSAFACFLQADMSAPFWSSHFSLVTS